MTDSDRAEGRDTRSEPRRPMRIGIGLPLRNGERNVIGTTAVVRIPFHGLINIVAVPVSGQGLHPGGSGADPSLELELSNP
jgi:hypothetical protein